MSLYETHLEFVDQMRMIIGNPSRNIFEQELLNNYIHLLEESHGDSEIAFAKLYVHTEKLNESSMLSEKKGTIRKGIVAAAVLSALAFGGLKTKQHIQNAQQTEKEMYAVIDNYPGDETFYAQCQNIVSLVSLSDSPEQISDTFADELKRLDAESGGYISKKGNLDKLLHVLTSTLYWHFEYQEPTKSHKIIELTKKKFKQ